MKTKHKAKEIMASLLTGHHDRCTHNHYNDAMTGINIIYELSPEDEIFTVNEFMTLHVHFCNKMMHNIIGDKKKRFVLDKENQRVITEKKGFITGWSETRSQTYDQVFLEDFDLLPSERM